MDATKKRLSMANKPGFLDYCPRCNSVAEHLLSSEWKRIFVWP